MINYEKMVYSVCGAMVAVALVFSDGTIAIAGAAAIGGALVGKIV